MDQRWLDWGVRAITQSPQRILALIVRITRASRAPCRSETSGDHEEWTEGGMVRLVLLVAGGALSVLLITAPCDSRTLSKETKSQRAAVGSQEALRAPDTSPGHADNAEGIEYYTQGQWDLAAHHFRKAILADPGLAEAHFNLALAMDKLAKPHDARAAFKKAVELAPDDQRMKDASILKQSMSK